MLLGPLRRVRTTAATTAPGAALRRWMAYDRGDRDDRGRGGGGGGRGGRGDGGYGGDRRPSGGGGERGRVGRDDGWRRRVRVKNDDKSLDDAYDPPSAEKLAQLARLRQARPWWEAKPWTLTVHEPMAIPELARVSKINAQDLERTARRTGMLPRTRSTPMVVDDMQLLMAEFNCELKYEALEWEAKRRPPPERDDPNLVKRPPVVTVMGHVDHGKTTLLDSLRRTSVAAGEAGGITQHIGAFLVTLPSGNKITFLDTPGHVAFSSMRARGANMTDLVVLVVAKDDGIMPQTVEAINHAKAARAPIIVAINKCDKDIQQPPRILDDLIANGLQPEQVGGDVQVIEVSALKNLNLDVLEEAIVTQAEVMDLKGDPTGPVEGVIVESRTDRGRGNSATVLVQRGTLKPGDCIVAGTAWTRVRRILADNGDELKTAAPSVPAEVIGWRELPAAGDVVIGAPSEDEAKEAAERLRAAQQNSKTAKSVVALRERSERADETRSEIRRLEQAIKNHTITPEERKRYNELWYDYAKDGPTGKELALVIKGDIAASVSKLRNDDAHVRVLHTAVGEVTESDVTLAAASGAQVLAFNVPVSREAKTAAKVHSVAVSSYGIIYSLLDDVRAMLSKLLGTETVQVTVGEATVQQIFQISGGKMVVAGIRVSDGEFKRAHQFQVLRNGQVIFTGSASTLKHFKKDVELVTKGNECGLALEGFVDFREGDTVRCVRDDEVPRKFVEHKEKPQRAAGQTSSRGQSDRGRAQGPPRAAVANG